MQIRACSYLDEVVIDRPDPLYRQFHRLGVYTWQNILQIAKHDKTCDLMALRFSGTELFQTPVEWNVVQQILEEEMGKPFRLTSPLHISAKCFFQLYRLGTK